MFTDNTSNCTGRQTTHNSEGWPYRGQTVAHTFPLGDVTINGDNRLTHNRDEALREICSWDVTQQLYNYRDTYGLSTDGYTRSDGWDAPNCKLKGHGSGHYMSALAQAYAIATDPQQKDILRRNIVRMVDELRQCQERTFVKDEKLGRHWEARDFAPEAELKEMKGTWEAFDEYKKHPEKYGYGYLNATKPFGNETPQSTCCGGTGSENHTKYQEAAYFANDNTLWVALYMPTTLNWKDKGMKIVQNCLWPAEKTSIRIDEGQGKFTMKLRVPYWATNGFTVKLNGIVLTPPTRGQGGSTSYFPIARTWKKGDVVEVEMQTYVVKFKVQNVCDMLRAVSERFEPTFAQNGVEFVTEYPDPHFTAIIDDEAVTKVISNLLTNARKYTRDCVRLSCIISPDENHFIRLFCNLVEKDVFYHEFIL